MHFAHMKRCMKIRSRILLATLFALAALGCGGGSVAASAPQAETAPPPVEQTAAEPVVGNFSLRDVDGVSRTLSDYLGTHVIVVSYFATWCAPCQKELVALESLYQTYQNRGVQILAVAMDLPETRGEVRPLVKKLGLSFPVLIDEELKAADLFNPRREAPFSLVINANRERIWSHMGYVPGDEKALEGVIQSALAAREASETAAP